MAIVENSEPEIFENLLFFEREVPNPQIVKREIDSIMPKLRKIGVKHKNIVISKVINTNSTKKTMLMQIRIPINESHQLAQFFEDNPQYILESSFVIKKGVKIIIDNNEREFHNGIKLLMARRPDFDMSQNHIIELSHISFDGKVLGFELFLED